jgi:hypothetical protein
MDNCWTDFLSVRQFYVWKTLVSDLFTWNSLPLTAALIPVDAPGLGLFVGQQDFTV